MGKDKHAPGPTALTAADAWTQEWARVPPAWRTPCYRLDRAPANDVFSRNARYLASSKDYDFTPAGPHRLGQELAWWVFTCWAEGHRKIEPSMLAWWRRAVEVLARNGPVTSIGQLEPAQVIRHATLLFQRRNGRLPSPGNQRNLTTLAEHIHLMVSTRCGNTPWWAHDIWDQRIDDSIPRRQHEPHRDRALRLVSIHPGWPRDGVRFWLRTALTHQMLTWTTALTRARTVGGHLGRYAQLRGLQDPLTGDDPAEVRAFFLDFLAHLRSPAATNDATRLGEATVAAIQSHVQSFYIFIHDHAAKTSAATGHPRWAQISVEHTRLWAPSHRRRRHGNTRQLSWIAAADLRRMLTYLDVLGAGTDQRVTITSDDDSIAVLPGLGDPQAMRIWLLQAMTGRRASEILMLDFDPLTAISSIEADPAEESQFVARLRYQQTKIDGIDPTILVEQAIVNIITEQQRWHRTTHPACTPRYLFAGLRHNHRGDQPRTYTSYQDALARLDDQHGLTDTAGHPLRFTQTHRLRHTRATELLNDGVPFHVVQRYLGHKSPEMTARYAATLAATAEVEFLKHKKIGAHGAAIDISPRDIYEITQLSKRTDRVLPNGICLLPPVKTCDKGNACLSCGHFATDQTHLAELTQQRSDTLDLLAQRRRDYTTRTGRHLDDNNIWVTARLHEIASLEAIITTLTTPGAEPSRVATGSGTQPRRPLLQIQTRGAHHSLLNQNSTPPPAR